MVYLHYVDAKEIAPILKSLVDSIKESQQELKDSISIESSESSNALVINAPPAMLATMKRVIKQLDIRRAQVLVEALIVEVSGDVANDLGVTWLSTNDPNTGVVGAVNTLGNLELAETVIGADLSPRYGPAPGFTFGYFENGDLQAAIRALDSNTNANVLSTPTVVALNNEEASLLVGQNVPFITDESTSGSSPTSDPFTTIERHDIGITLTITPRINQGDSITLDILQKTESIAPSVQDASDIVTNKREIPTKALIHDGQILVLGGLISDEETEAVQKVPFFGDLPLIGRLFCSKSTSHSKKNLMVFIHPVILKDDEYIEMITRKRYDFMKNLRKQVSDNEWQIDPSKTSTMEEFETFSPVNAQ